MGSLRRDLKEKSERFPFTIRSTRFVRTMGWITIPEHRHERTDRATLPTRPPTSSALLFNVVANTDSYTSLDQALGRSLVPNTTEAEVTPLAVKCATLFRG